MVQKLSIFILVLSLWACSRKENKNGLLSDTKRVEITPFKINKVILKDTQLIKTIYMWADSGRMSVQEYNSNWGRDYKYLDHTQFSALRKAMWALVKNPGSRVYVDPMGKVATPQEVKDRIIQCGMIEESSFDAEGNEIIQSRMNCDSMSTIRNINQIRYFEAWYFNPANNMIERDLLGYSVHEWVGDKGAFRELFTVFVSDEALEKSRKYYFNKQ